MRESDLYVPIRNWLRARGYEVHAEVYGCDIIAVKDRQLTVVEMKLQSSKSLLTQCELRTNFADYVYAAIPCESRNKPWFRYQGIGLLQVMPNGAVRQRIKPRPQPWQWEKRHAYRLAGLTGRPEAMDHETAGLPSCRKLREQRALRTPLVDRDDGQGEG